VQHIHEYLELDTPMILFHGGLIVANKEHPELALINEFISADDVKRILKKIDFFKTAHSIHAIGIGKAVEINDLEDLEMLDFDVYEFVVMYKQDSDMNPELVRSQLEGFHNIEFKYIAGIENTPEDLYLFMAEGIDKVHAVKEVARYYNIPQERVMFFGDNLNDYDAVK
jgi:HAD superfamily hydrolase (TIGR01484 family)